MLVHHTIALQHRGGGCTRLRIIIICTIFFIVGMIIDSPSYHQQQKYIRSSSRRRKAMYLPPSPIRPFSGGIKKSSVPSSEEEKEKKSSSVPSEEEEKDNDNNNSNSVGRDVDGIIMPWAPEDYPDPWTNPLLCGGAATAYLLNNEDRTNNDTNFYPNGEDIGNKLPLFCDPDQVLDKVTLWNIFGKLRNFVEEFASGDVLEGVDYGGDSDDNPEDIDTPQADHLPLPILDHTLDEKPENFDIQHFDDSKKQRRILSSSYHTELRGKYADSVGGIFSTTHKDTRDAKKKESVHDYKIEVGIALVNKINLPAILRADSYFFYSDQDDMVNDAAQYFARYIHDTWSRRLSQERKAAGNESSPPTNIVLIFISTLDRICYISSGTRITAMLPWWRLEHVVQDMKTDLRRNKTGEALGVAIDDLTSLLKEGPPTFTDRVDDFFERFGIVILFTTLTFIFATWGEFRDRHRRIFLGERKSRMTAKEREKARALQREFKTKMCPICLEPFDSSSSPSDDDKDHPDKDNDDSNNSATTARKDSMKRVDSYGIFKKGSDDQPLKLLRCGHIFDTTCWQTWVNSGQGNPWICPVCRQDVGRPKRGGSNAQRNGAEEDGGGDRDETIVFDTTSNHEQSSLFARIMTNTSIRPVTNSYAQSAQSNYNSIRQSRVVQQSRSWDASYPISRGFLHPGIHPMLGMAVIPLTEAELGEQTPLFARTTASIEDENSDD